jgi:hypothetical protein
MSIQSMFDENLPDPQPLIDRIDCLDGMLDAEVLIDRILFGLVRIANPAL